jgi:hypothetical protein
VRNNRRVSRFPGKRNGVQRFGHGPNLIELDQHRVRHPVGNAPSQNVRVGHEDIVADELHP